MLTVLGGHMQALQIYNCIYYILHLYIDRQNTENLKYIHERGIISSIPVE